MKTYSVHQPHYLPYPGYLEKVARSDEFVFLEQVQYVRREYQNRNRIRSPQGPQWLIVPVLLLSVPIFDMTMTTIVRFGTGKVRTFGEWLAYTGRDHFHHRLAALGIGRFNAVLVIYTVTLIIGIPAVVLKQARGVDAWLLLSQSALFFLLLTYFMIFVRTHQIRLFVEEQTKQTENGRELEPQVLEVLLADADKPAEKEGV